jgi:hypothetical protein
MSLAFPKNLANRDDTSQTVLALLETLPGPVSYHVFDGQPATTAIGSDELSVASDLIAKCSIVYALDGIRGIREPIAGFVGNELLGTAKLLHLIDDRPPTGDGTIQRRTMDMLAVYIRYLFTDFDWIHRVTVPSNVQFIDKLLDLRVTGDAVSCITLIDSNHRPKSSRTYGG